MVLSRRERYIAVVTVGVVASVVLYRYMLAPMVTQASELNAKIADAQIKLSRTKGVFENSSLARRRLGEMVGKSLLKNESEAESQVLNSIREWSQDAGINLSVKHERTEREKDFMKISFRASGNGSMSQIGRFLWRMQMANVPVRTSDLLISSTRREGSDDLTVSLGISTIYLIGDVK